jgi:hypothetical protein
MFSCQCRCPQAELRLHAVEQFVEEELLALTRRPVGHVVPRVCAPRRAAPLDRRVHKTEQSRPGRFRCLLLVAIVCVRLSAITIGPQIDTPHRRPPSRSQSAWASLKYSCARC